MKPFLSLLCAASIFLGAGLSLSGCGPDAPAPSSGIVFSYKDQQITLAAPPQRVVTLSTPLLNMAYAVGGKSIARAATKSAIPDEARDLPQLGQVSHIDMEKLVGLSPDLVLGEKSQNQKLESLLAGNQIPYFMINYDGIHDNVPLMAFLGAIYGKDREAASVIASYEKRIDDITAKAAAHTPARVAVLRATGKDVTAETPAAICASMTEALHMENVIASHGNLPRGNKTVPYSLEQLSGDDPDVIFIVTMGQADEINKKLDETLRDNPAWSHLKAVQTGRVYFLPYELYLMNPGIRTPEAMEHLASLAYPDL